MRVWEFKIKHEGNLLNIRIEAKYYYDACLETQKKYPGCVIKNISEIRF